MVALDRVTLEVERGAVHAVVGENGAGKSTLMKILAGSVEPDGGRVQLEGEPMGFGSPHTARRQGIGIVYQELSLFPHRSVLANLFVQSEPTRRGFVSRREMQRRAGPVLERVGLDLDPERRVGEFGVGERQLIELSRVLLEEPRLLILDEPNSALNEQETSRLFAVLRDLRAHGITVLYVSHRLEEVFEIADRISVMRNGRQVFTRDAAELTIPEVVRGMVGVREGELFPARSARGDEDADVTAGASVRLEVRDLVVGEELRGISFDAHGGEIVGLAGLEGSGVATLLGALFGAVRVDRGEVRYPDGAGLPRNTTDAARRGISLVPADRRRQGLMLEGTVARNIGHVAVGTLPAPSPWLNAGQLLAAARRQMDSLQIKASSPAHVVDQLSGGNQQKVVIGKWLEVGPRVVLLDDPTRGVDVGAKREIYLLVRRLAAEGRIVLFRSTELPELVGLADRILILYRGRIAGECSAGSMDSSTLLDAINTGTLRRASQEEDL
ncbi:sugar ABC transporter ATP-binding protein [soil metagenome]